MKRRNAVLTAALALLAALVAFGTVAHFSGEAHVTNVITTGQIDITLNEYTKDENGEPISWPSNGISGVMPGQSVDKLVSVKSEAGSGDAWVRVQVDTLIVPAGATLESEERLPDNGMLIFNFDTDNWIVGEDGYYYYRDSLKAGDTTPELFTTVTFDKTMPNEYQGCTAYVYVTAQAVQVKNNQGTDKETPIEELTESNYTQILGWSAPET